MQVVFFNRNGKSNIINVSGLIDCDTSKMTQKFLHHSLSIAPIYVNRGMGNPKLMSNVMARAEIPLPPLEEQQRIVTILDKFDALVNDLKFGIPAEIEARKRQYEYYREKLLSFKRCE